MNDDAPQPDLARQRLTMSGLEHLRKLAAGDVAPAGMIAAMGFRLAEVAEGHVVMTAQIDERFNNGIGIIHGGYAATLLDSAMGSAVNSMMPAGRIFTTLEMKINYVRPLRAETQRVRCEATVIHVGGRAATAEGRITDEAGVLYAHGTTTCMLFRLDPAP
jgi:uncharacterized protein (TIGR00369 family)